MAGKRRRLFHRKKCMPTGDVSELVKREGKFYVLMYFKEKKGINVEVTLMGLFWVFFCPCFQRRFQLLACLVHASNPVILLYISVNV